MMISGQRAHPSWVLHRRGDRYRETPQGSRAGWRPDARQPGNCTTIERTHRYLTVTKQFSDLFPVLNSAMPRETLQTSSAASIAAARAALLKHAARDAVDYLEGVDERPVAPTPEAVAGLAALRGPLPPGPTSPEAVLHLLNEFGSPATVANGGGRYFGFVNGGCLPAAMAAAWLVSAWDQNAAMQVQSPAAAALEETALEWVRQLLGLPEGCGGAVVTGATMANFSALAAARHALLARAGWDAESEGLFGAPPITVVVG